MILETYGKTLEKIEGYLLESSEIFIINSVGFTLTLAIAKSIDLQKMKLKSFTLIDIETILPNIFTILQEAKSLKSLDDIYSGALFPLEFITSHGFSWVSTSSEVYKYTLRYETTPFMDDWQKFIRAKRSTSKAELAYLALDPNQKIREEATNRLSEM